MAVHPSLRRARHDSTPLIAVVVSLVLVLAGLLVWQSAQAQDRLGSLGTGQTTGLEQRTDQQQLTCALWAVLRDDAKVEVPADVREAADRICSTVPTPTQTKSP